MENNPNLLPASIDTPTKEQASTPQPGMADETPAAQSVLRLLVGAMLEGGAALAEGLRNQQDLDSLRTSDREQNAPLRQTAVGLLFQSVKVAQRGATQMTNSADRLSRMAVAPFKPVVGSRLFRPVRNRIDTLAERGQRELDELMRIGQVEEQRSRETSQQVLNEVVNTVVGDLSKETPGNPQLDELVRLLVNNYINYLNEHPEQVQSLIRNQADVYITYLNANPEPVQTLLAAQSLSLTAQIREEMNERMVTADSLLEMLARRLFRRPPREALSGPPPEVKALASSFSIKSDIPVLKAGQDEPG